MQLTLTNDEMTAFHQELAESNAAFKRHYPADSFHRQPVHTVYGGVNLFKAGFAGKLGAIASREGIKALNGTRRTWFTGSYFGFGFHEDAVKASVDLVRDHFTSGS